MGSANRRNLIAAALPVFLLLLLVGAVRLVPSALPSQQDTAPVKPAALSPPPQPGDTQAPNTKRKPPLPWHPADAATQKAVGSRVIGQIGAFRSDDYRHALEFSAKGFRTSTTPESFRRLIQGGYPGLAYATGAKTGLVKMSGTNAAQVEVYLTGTKDGEASGFDYLLIKEGSDWNVVSASPIYVPGNEVPVPSRQQQRSRRL